MKQTALLGRTAGLRPRRCGGWSGWRTGATPRPMAPTC